MLFGTQQQEDGLGEELAGAAAVVAEGLGMSADEADLVLDEADMDAEGAEAFVGASKSTRRYVILVKMDGSISMSLHQNEVVAGVNAMLAELRGLPNAKDIFVAFSIFPQSSDVFGPVPVTACPNMILGRGFDRETLEYFANGSGTPLHAAMLGGVGDAVILQAKAQEVGITTRFLLGILTDGADTTRDGKGPEVGPALEGWLSRTTQYRVMPFGSEAEHYMEKMGIPPERFIDTKDVGLALAEFSQFAALDSNIEVKATGDAK